MNREPLRADRSFGNAPRLVAVSAEELTLVTGGGIFSWLKDAAVWVKDHVFVDLGNRVIGYKGTF
jgi:hypothetical protein